MDTSIYDTQVANKKASTRDGRRYSGLQMGRKERGKEAEDSRSMQSCGYLNSGMTPGSPGCVPSCLPVAAG